MTLLKQHIRKSYLKFKKEIDTENTGILYQNQSYQNEKDKKSKELVQKNEYSPPSIQVESVESIDSNKESETLKETKQGD